MVGRAAEPKDELYVVDVRCPQDELHYPLSDQCLIKYVAFPQLVCARQQHSPANYSSVRACHTSTSISIVDCRRVTGRVRGYSHTEILSGARQADLEERMTRPWRQTSGHSQQSIGRELHCDKFFRFDALGDKIIKAAQTVPRGL